MATSKIPYNADVNNFIVVVGEQEKTSDATYGVINATLAYRQSRGYDMVAAICIPQDGNYYATFKQISANGAAQFYLIKVSDGTRVKSKTLTCTFISFYKKASV